VDSEDRLPVLRTPSHRAERREVSSETSDAAAIKADPEDGVSSSLSQHREVTAVEIATHDGIRCNAALHELSPSACPASVIVGFIASEAPADLPSG
jgi:hypothetical protein